MTPTKVRVLIGAGLLWLAYALSTTPPQPPPSPAPPVVQPEPAHPEPPVPDRPV